MSSTIKNKGWLVTFSGTGINLALGILYTWSIFKGAIESSIKAGGEGAFTPSYFSVRSFTITYNNLLHARQQIHGQRTGYGIISLQFRTNKRHGVIDETI